jgi:hypothetical protein
MSSRLIVTLLGAAVFLGACTQAPRAVETPAPSLEPAVPATGPPDPVIAAAGDIACPPERSRTRSECAQGATAALITRGDYAAVLALGDLQYDLGSATGFRRSYASSWGRFKAVTHPAPGNHDYGTKGAAGYYAYFGEAAGDPGKGYYSFDLGRWHLIALNSNCFAVGGCERGSAQERWLRDDLAAHPAACTLAYWHHPRFSSGVHGNDERFDAFWRALYEAGADVVLAGHDHDYERFGPQTPDARADERRGLREFVVGTGGRSLYRLLFTRPNSQVRDGSTFGVLALTLHAESYDWRFVPVGSGGFTDAGTGRCH